MTTKLISKWHNQQVGDAVRQQWLYKAGDTYRLDHYTAVYGGEEWSETLTTAQAEDAQAAHAKGYGWDHEAYRMGYRY